MYLQNRIRKPGEKGFTFVETIEQAILAPTAMPLRLPRGRTLICLVLGGERADAVSEGAVMEKTFASGEAGSWVRWLHPGSDAAELLADEREQAEPPTSRPLVGGLDRVAA